MFEAKLGSLVKAVAKSSGDPGARSWTICIMPRPSSVPALDLSATVETVVWPQVLAAPGRLSLTMSPAAFVNGAAALL